MSASMSSNTKQNLRCKETQDRQNMFSGKTILSKLKCVKQDVAQVCHSAVLQKPTARHHEDVQSNHSNSCHIHPDHASDPDAKGKTKPSHKIEL